MPPRSAIVTGGASGLGKAVSEKLASRGINVLIVDRLEHQAKDVAANLSATYSVDATSIALDITKEDDVKLMVETAVKRWGRLDYASNCAGICETIWEGDEDITTDLVNKTFEVNQRGLWLCQKYEALQMKSQEPLPVEYTPPSSFPVPGQRGSIVNFSSVSGMTAMGLAAYTPTKFAAIGITLNGAKFYGPHGVRCNAICPGMTFSPLAERALGPAGDAGSKESKDSAVSQMFALRRLAFPQEQANVVSFLLSDESSYVNGAQIPVDGGFTQIR